METRARNRKPISTATIPASASAGVVVCETVSRTGAVPIEELPPLGRTVDVDAIDALFAGDRGRGTVGFRYAGYDVVVTSTGSVELYSGGTPTV